MAPKKILRKANILNGLGIRYFSAQWQRLPPNIRSQIMQMKCKVTESALATLYGGIRLGYGYPNKNEKQ